MAPLFSMAHFSALLIRFERPLRRTNFIHRHIPAMPNLVAIGQSGHPIKPHQSSPIYEYAP